MSQDWNISSRSRVCAVCEKPFDDKSLIYSCLSVGEEGYVRQDISDECWPNTDKSKLISFWKSTYIAPPPPAAEPLKKETVETLLRQFMSREDYSQLDVVFILVVMLERKRILVERDVQRRDDGVKIRIYEHKQTGEIFTVPDPELRLDQIAEVQGKVNHLLGLVPAGAPESAPAAPDVEPAEKPEG